MAWYITVFAAVLGLCAVIYAVGFLRDCLAPKRTQSAVVEKRYKETFPLTVGLSRRDRQELHLAFRTEEGQILNFKVGEELYNRSPAGTTGTLSHQGTRLLGFEPSPGER